MKKIKIIDLLNMIAEGKEVPYHIEFNGQDWYWNDFDSYVTKATLLNTPDAQISIFSKYRLEFALNKEVVIVEEDNNKIEYLEEKDFDDDIDTDEKCEILREWYQDLKNKQDEIIDKLNNMEENYGRK